MEVWWLVGIYICILLFHLAGAHRPRSGVGNDEARALPRSAASASSSGDNNAALKQLPVPSEALELKLREKAGDVMYKFNAESDMRQTRDSTRCKLSSPHPSSPFQTSPPDSAPIVVAVGFFGLSRNLSRTVRSIRKHVFEVFDRQGIAYDVFWSTMHTALLTNLRSRENDVKLYESDHEVLQLPLCSVRVFSQANVRPRLFNHYMSRTRHDPWQDEYASLKNVLGAYYSQIKLWDQIEAQQVRSGRVYDAVLVLRPDTAILNDIDLPQYLPSLAHIARNVGSTHDRVAAVYSFTLIGEQTDLRGENISLRSLWVPSFHSYLGYNDRLAFGSAAAVQTYLTRGGLYLDATLGFNKSQGMICLRDGVHRNTGECFLGLVAGAFGLDVRFTPASPLRIRSDGSLPSHDSGPAFVSQLPPSARVGYRKCVVGEPSKFVARPAGGTGRFATKISPVRRWIWDSSRC